MRSGVMRILGRRGEHLNELHAEVVLFDHFLYYSHLCPFNYLNIKI